jgi:hypothetical protein
MLKTLTFGEWAPDLASSNGKHLSVATNVRAIANGYSPVKAYQQIAPPLPASGVFHGGAAFVDSTGETHLLAASEAFLFRLVDGEWDSLGAISGGPWRFEQFGDNVLCCGGGLLAQYDMSDGSLDNIADSPDNCIDVFRVRDFIMVVLDDDRAAWSEFNDALGWTFGTNQSDDQPLLGGGKGIGGVGGEYGLIFQQNEVKRVSYVGSTDGIIFQFDQISAEVGCMVRGSICNVGRLTFFLSERGFMMCDGTEVTPIADEKFNRWFFGTYSRAQIADMTSAVDPRRSVVMWGMPGAPGKIIAYNWVLQRATVIETDLSGIFTGFTTNTSLEDLDDLYPEGLDSMDVSLDDPIFAGGSPLLIVVDQTSAFGTLNGANLTATVGVENIELTSGRRSRLRAVRPVTDATNASVTIDARMRMGDGESLRSAGSMRASGKMPIRSNGRYMDTSISIPAGEIWTFIQGAEFEFEPGDNR